MNPKPSTARNARRSLMFEAEGTRVIVGATWMPMRIIADSKQEAIDAAMRVWRSNGTVPVPR